MPGHTGGTPVAGAGPSRPSGGRRVWGNAGSAGSGDGHDLGRPLLDVPADWELFGQGQGVVVRMELGRGRVTRTAVPEVGSASPTFFVVGHDRVIVHPMDLVPGYVVRDGKPAAPAATRAGPGLPRRCPARTRGTCGPRPGPAPRSALSLLTLDGRPAGIQLPIPKGATVQSLRPCGERR